MHPTNRLAAAALLPLLFSCVASDPTPVRASADDPAWAEANADMHERLAQKALDDGRLDDAATNAREALRIAADRKSAALVLARVQLLSGHPDDAERTCLELLDHDETCVEAWLLRGEALTAQKRFSAANESYRSATEQGSIQGTFAQATQNALDGEGSRALAALDAAGVRSSSDPAVLKDAAAHWLATGDRSTARELLTSAAELDHDDRALARLLERDAALDGGPLPEGGAVDDRLTRAAASLRRGDSASAAALYGALAQELQSDAGVRIALGEALLRGGDWAGAESSFRAATKLDATASAAWLGIARAQLAAKRPGEAVTTLTTALRDLPDRVAMRGMLVAAALAAGDVTLATAEAERVRESAPGSALDMRCRAALAEAAGQGAP
ncbi:MAG: tetratricopeptide repeat protein [Planctomycetes bacterium]|nr:tetratricopeptide repeat protein [Planctomycetota bacterium]MCC7173458.1 tetratricopeptide repeat protein [Planctomycetota bacterium]